MSLNEQLMPSAPPSAESVVVVGTVVTSPMVMPAALVNAPQQVVNHPNSGNIVAEIGKLNKDELSEDKSREALVKEVNKHFFWGQFVANTCTISSQENLGAFLITLESFNETRTIKKIAEPYFGGEHTWRRPGIVETPDRWDFNMSTITPASYFGPPITEQFELQFTSELHPCSGCHGAKNIPCNNCKGAGKSNCGFCQGRGTRARLQDGQQVGVENCGPCMGSGRVQCNRCHGQGTTQCLNCRGAGSMRHYEKLVRKLCTVTHQRVVTSITDNGVVQQLANALPFTSAVLLEEVQHTVPAFSGLRPDIDAALLSLVSECAKEAVRSDATIFQQRVRVCFVPVALIKAGHKTKQFQWYLIGDKQQQCIVLDYPAQFCWGLFLDCCV